MSEIPVSPVLSDAILHKMKIAADDKPKKRKKSKENSETSEEIVVEKTTE